MIEVVPHRPSRAVRERADIDTQLSTPKEDPQTGAINDLGVRSEIVPIARNNLTSEWIAV